MIKLDETKKSMGLAFKNMATKLSLPGEISKKVSTKMRMEAKLEDGANVIIACAEIKSSRVPGNYGLYWLFSLSDGPIYNCMQNLNLHVSQSFSGNVILRGTSHNLNSGESHYEINSCVNFDEISSSICNDIERFCFPILEEFTHHYSGGVDFIRNGGAGFVRNPFVTSVILLGLIKDLDRIGEIIDAAKNDHRYYDFHAAKDYEKEIIEPIQHWFLNNR